MYRNFFKRTIDLFFSLFTLILLTPLLAALAVLIRTKLGSPILFTQERPGLNEKTFKLYKFRTMTDETDEHGELLPDSKRLTSFGEWLRATSLDELPELFNILIGDMSLVGPRPLLLNYLPYYSEAERARHTVRPGLTGLAQINGRNHLDWDDRLELDVEYVHTLSFMLDAAIFLATIKKVIKKENVAIADKNPMQDLHVERRDLSVDQTTGQ